MTHPTARRSVGVGWLERKRSAGTMRRSQSGVCASRLCLWCISQGTLSFAAVTSSSPSRNGLAPQNFISLSHRTQTEGPASQGSCPACGDPRPGPSSSLGSAGGGVWGSSCHHGWKQHITFAHFSLSITSHVFSFFPFLGSAVSAQDGGPGDGIWCVSTMVSITQQDPLLCFRSQGGGSWTGR